jgi:hypothetical protein
MCSQRLCRCCARCSSICATCSRLSSALVPAGNSNTSVASNGLTTCTAWSAAWVIRTGPGAPGLIAATGAAGWPDSCDPHHQASTATAIVPAAIFARGDCSQRTRLEVSPTGAGSAARASSSICSGVSCRSTVSSPTAAETMLGSFTDWVPPRRIVRCSAPAVCRWRPRLHRELQGRDGRLLLAGEICDAAESDRESGSATAGVGQRLVKTNWVASMTSR